MDSIHSALSSRDKRSAGYNGNAGGIEKNVALLTLSLLFSLSSPGNPIIYIDAGCRDCPVVGACNANVDFCHWS